MKKLAILGPGVVGGSCAEILLRDADLLERNAGEQLELSYVLARRALPDRPYKDKVVTDFSVIERDANVFLVIETIGGCGAALEYVRRALAAGKHVVTANKQLIAEHGAELLALAKANGVSLLFEASVGGGIPVLHPLSQCLGANEIYEVRGILNGTTNYMLSAMTNSGADYAPALRKAQELGYAEADPTADVEGLDARRKIVLSADLAFGVNIREEDIPCVGISSITAGDIAKAKDEGLTYKLIARAEKSGRAVAAFVCPTLFPSSAPEAHTDGTGNLVTLFASRFGKQSFSGAGAGGYPTGSNVLRDCLDVADGCRSFYADSFTPCSVNLSGTQCKGLIRCMVEDLTRECSARESVDAYEAYRKDDPHALLARYAAEEE